jgi:hypothetical protein
MTNSNSNTETKIISYRADNAKYSTEFAALTKKLMPAKGEASSVEGELIRIANRYLWDYYNNGNMNILEIRWETEEYCAGHDEDGEEIWEEEEYHDGAFITDYYENMLTFAANTLPNKDVVNALHELVINMEHDCQYNQAEADVYNAFTDAIVEFVISKNGEYTAFKGYEYYNQN